MFTTGIYEILNVWANDADKFAVFVGGLTLPVLFYFIYRFDNITEIKKMVYKDSIPESRLSFLLRIIFTLIIVSYVIALAGIGQLVLMPLIDALVRALGAVIYLNGITLLLVLNNLKTSFFDGKKRDIRSMFFCNEVRYPEYFFVFMIALGSSLMSLSFAGIILSNLVLLPFIILKIKKEEKSLVNIDSRYYNYSIDVPMMFPDIKDFIKRLFFKKIIR